MRLDKLVTGAGLTRSEAKKAIAKGRVTEDGVPVKDPGSEASGRVFYLDGRRLCEERELLIALNKPAGVVSATRDGNLTDLYRFFPQEIVRRAPGPCGRLDVDVTGLILLTTDGQLAHRLISPKRNVEKVYEATVEGTFGEDNADEIRRGIVFKDYTSRPAKVEVLERTDSCTMIRLTLTEGKYHEVKKLCAKTGHPVIRLRRVAEAGVMLGDLPEGEWRYLTDEEEKRVREAAGETDE